MRAGVLKSPHAGMFQFSGNAPDTATALNTLYREQERRKRVLGWRRTHKDPFAGEWEQITAWLVANPQRSSGDVFRSCSAAPLDAISPCRSALFSEACA